jgi:hypothetical protein
LKSVVLNEDSLYNTPDGILSGRALLLLLSRGGFETRLYGISITPTPSRLKIFVSYLCDSLVTLDDALGDFAFGEQRAAALGAGAAEALIDGKDFYFFEFIFIEAADGEHVFPVGGIARVAFLTTAGAGVEEIGRGSFQIQIETLLGVGGEKADGLILKD